VPFKRIAMGIVGPLLRSQSGNQYILVVCDYATRYSEAVAIKSIEAGRIAEELIELFAKVVVLEEILTDQGSTLLPPSWQNFIVCYMYTPSVQALIIPRQIV